MVGKLFNPEQDENQRTLYETRLTERFDREIQEVFDQVIQKARYLIKLSVPQIFQDAKKQQLEEVLDKMQEENKEFDPDEESKVINRLSHSKTLILKKKRSGNE